MKISRASGFLLIFLLAIIVHCTQQTTLKVLKPAEIDVGPINRIAILNFDGPSDIGASIASMFTSKLFSTNYFTLVERSELEKVLNEHALNMSGVVDVETAVEAGRLLGVQGVIVGEVISYSCDDQKHREKEKRRIWTGDYERDEKGNIIYEKTFFGKKVKKKKYREELVTVEVLDREATVALSFRLIDVETGRIVATRETSHSFQQSIKREKGSLPPKKAILNRLTNLCIDDFVKMLAPHTMTIKTQFARGNREVNKGIEFARNGLWDKAQEVWEAVVARDPGNHQGWYNLGLAYEAQLDYENAEQAYDHAVDIKPKKTYMKALKRVRQAMLDEIKLQQQLKREKMESTGEQYDE